MRIAEMRKTLTSAGYESYANLIEAKAPRCVRFDLIPADLGEIPAGESKFGDCPDLPPDIQWPSHGGAPLNFVLQINFRDIAPYACCRELPQEGWLFFFCDAGADQLGNDPNDRGRWQVIFHAGPQEALEYRERPWCDGIPLWHLLPNRLSFFESLSPGWEDIPITLLGLSDREIDEFMHVVYSIPEREAHQLLGTPGRIESLADQMHEDVAFVSACLNGENHVVEVVSSDEVTKEAPHTNGIRLLLQLDSDRAGIAWGEAGTLYVWIREDDLRRHNFTNVWVTLDSFDSDEEG